MEVEDLDENFNPLDTIIMIPIIQVPGCGCGCLSVVVVVVVVVVVDCCVCVCVLCVCVCVFLLFNVQCHIYIPHAHVVYFTYMPSHMVKCSY